jgi:serine/threonine-protein kinase
MPQFLEMLAIIAFIFVAYHAVVGYWELTAPKEVTVPKLVGLNEAEAQQVLRAAGLRAEVAARQGSEEAPESEVLASDPPPNRMVKAGRLVRLTVSSGSRWSIVPDATDMSVDRARALLRQENLTIGKETARFHNKVPLGYVIAHAPMPDQRVPRGTAVDLIVSKGPAPTAEPDERERQGARTTQVEYEVPPGANLQEVKIVVQDRQGERVVYRNFHHPGEKVVETVSGEGPEVVVRVFLSGVLDQEKNF